MYNVIVNIAITQIPSDKYPNRKKVFLIDGLNNYEWSSNWEELTDSGSITLPRNVIVVDENGQKQPLFGSNITIGGFNGEPLFMRGDRVTLTAGYSYFNKKGVQITELANPEIINGFVSKVHSSTPLKIGVENNMWLLKQTALKNKSFTDSNSLEDVMKFIIDAVNAKHGTALTYNATQQTGFGNFDVENETAAQLLSRLHKLYGFVSYFVGDTLYSGVLIQYPTTAQTHYFILDGENSNVPMSEEELEFQRIDDVVLSAVVHNTITTTEGMGTTKDGKQKTKKKRLQVLVSLKNGEITSRVIPEGEQEPENEDGERRTFFQPLAKTTTELIEFGKQQLEKYAYTGLKGTLTTFGIPYVKHGDNVVISSPKYPEQNGIYRVKSVTYRGDVGEGLRQDIELWYKILTT